MMCHVCGQDVDFNEGGLFWFASERFPQRVCWYCTELVNNKNPQWLAGPTLEHIKRKSLAQRAMDRMHQ